uniref:E3 ubiquitin-protein ligase RNF135 n=2 Tax=Sphenodon punctatus TaxID=8508 RepID=A0A8D0GGY5_SPHPU
MAVPVWLRPEDLHCSICLGLLESPGTLPCGHSYCLRCIGQWGQQRGAGRCPICQRAFPKRLPARNVLLQALLERYRRDTEGPTPGARCQPQRPAPQQHPAAEQNSKEKVRISEISQQIKTAQATIDNRRKDSRHIKEYISQIKDLIVEDFGAIKMYIEAKERAMLEIIDQEYQATQQGLKEMIEQLSVRANRLMEIEKQLPRGQQSNLGEQLSDTSSNGEIYIGSPVAVNKISLDDEKIRLVTSAVEELKKQLERLILEEYPEQLPQDTSPRTSRCQSNEVLNDMAVERASVTNISSQPVDSLLAPGASSSPVAFTSTSPAPRISSQFSQWADNVTFDLERVNCNLEVTAENRRVTVSCVQFAAPSPKRFCVSQVMCSQSFSDGRHYWEVNTEDSRAWAVGVASKEIGRDMQLGRDELSWCVEWSVMNKHLSAWHKNQQIQLSHVKPLRVGVFLDIPQNCLSFYSLTDTETLLHAFEINVLSPVYPAFWLYGLDYNGSLTLNHFGSSQHR